MSTFHSANATTVVTRHQYPRETITTPISTAVEDYNKHRCGVDRVDQMETYYRLGRRTKRWWPRLAWWLIDMCVINAYKLYTLKHSSKIRLLEFREKLMEELAGERRQPLHDITNKRRRSICRCKGLHVPSKSEHQRDCNWCSDRKSRRKTTVFCCHSCNVYLCMHPCFEQYHLAEHVCTNKQ